MKEHTTIGYTTLSSAERRLGYNSFLTYAKRLPGLIMKNGRSGYRMD
jgi:hypothetical protein